MSSRDPKNQGDCQKFRVLGAIGLESKRTEHGETHTRSTTVPRWANSANAVTPWYPASFAAIAMARIVASG